MTEEIVRNPIGWVRQVEIDSERSFRDFVERYGYYRQWWKGEEGEVAHSYIYEHFLKDMTRLVLVCPSTQSDPYAVTSNWIRYKDFKHRPVRTIPTGEVVFSTGIGHDNTFGSDALTWGVMVTAYGRIMESAMHPMTFREGFELHFQNFHIPHPSIPYTQGPVQECNKMLQEFNVLKPSKVVFRNCAFFLLKEYGRFGFEYNEALVKEIAEEHFDAPVTVIVDNWASRSDIVIARQAIYP